MGDKPKLMHIGDTLPVLTHTLKDTCANLVDLCAATDTIKLYLEEAVTRKVVLDYADATVNDPCGIVEYTFGATDVTIPGIYAGKWDVCGPDGCFHTIEPFYIQFVTPTYDANFRGISDLFMSPQAVRAELGIYDSAYDHMLIREIAAVQDAIEGWIGYNLFSTTYVHDGTTLPRLDGTGCESLFLPHIPVTEICSVSLRDEMAITSLTDPDYFMWESSTGELILVDRIWTVGRQRVSVTFTAGYSVWDGDVTTVTLPYDLAQVALEKIEQKMRQRGRGPWADQIEVAGTTVAYQSTDWTDEQKRTLNHYRHPAGMWVL